MWKTTCFWIDLMTKDEEKRVMVVVVAPDEELLRQWCAENCQHIWYLRGIDSELSFININCVANNDRFELIFASEQEGDAFVAMATDSVNDPSLKGGAWKE